MITGAGGRGEIGEGARDERHEKFLRLKAAMSPAHSKRTRPGPGNAVAHSSRARQEEQEVSEPFPELRVERRRAEEPGVDGLGDLEQMAPRGHLSLELFAELTETTRSGGEIGRTTVARRGTREVDEERRLLVDNELVFRIDRDLTVVARDEKLRPSSDARVEMPCDEGEEPVDLFELEVNEVAARPPNVLDEVEVVAVGKDERRGVGAGEQFYQGEGKVGSRSVRDVSGAVVDEAREPRTFETVPRHGHARESPAE